MIETSMSGVANLFGSASGFGPIVFVVILCILLWEAVIVLSAVIATIGFDRQRDRARKD